MVNHVNWCRDLNCYGCVCAHANIKDNQCKDCGYDWIEDNMEDRHGPVLGWMSDWEDYENDRMMVCVEHFRFAPCRACNWDTEEGLPNSWSDRPDHVAQVRAYMQNEATTADSILKLRDKLREERMDEHINRIKRPPIGTMNSPKPPDYFTLSWDDELHQTVMFDGQPIVQLSIPMFDDEPVTTTVIFPDKTYRTHYVPRANPPTKHEVVLTEGTIAEDVFGERRTLVAGEWIHENSRVDAEFVPYRIVGFKSA